jgi:hypothetical protein
MPKIPQSGSRLTNLLEANHAKMTKAGNEPLWKGPSVDGVTQSLLQNFLVCRERFRVKTVLGLGPAENFSQALEYGNMWHVCEEALSAKKPWKKPLEEYVLTLAKKFPQQTEQVFHWGKVCQTQFPIYQAWWAEHPDNDKRTPLLQEYAFKLPYKLPSGRIVYLRGKFDAVDFIENLCNLFLQENKSKGDIDAIGLRKMLASGFELQTMFYLIALILALEVDDTVKEKVKKIRGKVTKPLTVQGVRYNVIRRPLSGGKGSIRKHQPTKTNPQGETDEEFYKRLGETIDGLREPNGEHYYFMRWKVLISRKDVERFRKATLDPILEQLCDWWAWIEAGQPSGKIEVEASSLHFQYPYNVYNPLDDGRYSDVDNYLVDGSEVGLRKIETLFPELE